MIHSSHVENVVSVIGINSEFPCMCIQYQKVEMTKYSLLIHPKVWVT